MAKDTVVGTAGRVADVLDARDIAAFSKNVGDIELIKASQAAALLVQSLYEPIEMIQSPKLREDWLAMYRRHVWTYAGIFAISSTIARLPRTLVKVDRTTGDRETIGEHDVLLLLDYPSPQTTGYDWLEMEVIHLEACGNAYSEINYETRAVKRAESGSTVRKSRLPMELWPIRPDYLVPVPRKDGGGTDHWEFQVKKWGRKKRFEVDQILPMGYADPLDPLFGMGSLQPATDDLRQDVAMARWNLDFFAHGLTPQGVFRTDKTLQAYEAKEIAEQIKEFLLGNQRRVLVLGKGLEWEAVSTEAKDVEFLAGRAANREAVLAALGVPPVKVGLLEHAKYDNYRLQAEAFHRDTILPKLRKIEGALDLFLLPRYPDLQRTPAVDWKFEFDAAELLAEDEDKMTDRVIRKLDRGLLTINEALTELGQDTIEDEAVGGLRMVDSRLVPLESLIGGGGLPETGLEGAEQEVLKAIRQHEEHLDEVIAEKVRLALEAAEKS
ncbi:MAG TPA: phage portal protein [Anaerolineae bacterium]|nr:phage portal protein [Anaerolineae bacterium]